MKIVIVTPEAPHSTLGNAVTANRWARVLRELGHHVTLAMEWKPDASEDCDALIALHARRSHPSIDRFHRFQPLRPLIVGLTGTDLYGDLPAGNPEAKQSLELATRIVVLQRAALDELSPEISAKVSVIYQSAVPPSRPRPPREDVFEVCVLSHLRDVKDPLCAARAARQLHADSPVRILHAGRALSSDWEATAREEEQRNPRYTWLGDQSHDEAIQLLSGCRAVVLSSLMEGGASVIAEAVVCGVPIFCTRIPGNIGMLGHGYGGFFQPRDHSELSEKLRLAEKDPRTLEVLRDALLALRPRFSPEAEYAAWRDLF